MLDLYTSGIQNDKEEDTWAFIITKNTGILGENNGVCSVNSHDNAELIALHEALKWLNRKIPKDKSPIRIYTTSYINYIFNGMRKIIGFIVYGDSYVGDWKNDTWITDDDGIDLLLVEKIHNILVKLLKSGREIIFITLKGSRRDRRYDALENLEKNMIKDVEEEDKQFDKDTRGKLDISMRRKYRPVDMLFN